MRNMQVDYNQTYTTIASYSCSKRGYDPESQLWEGELGGADSKYWLYVPWTPGRGLG